MTAFFARFRERLKRARRRCFVPPAAEVAFFAVAPAVAGAVLLTGCDDLSYKAIEFPGVEVRATNKMIPWIISSKGDLPVPLYVSHKGKCLKLDSGATMDETKAFLNDVEIAYKEHYDPYREWKYYIIAGCLEFFYDDHGKLKHYALAYRDPETLIDGVRVGTSPEALFPIPLKFADIETMFGRDYKVYDRVEK